jgi:hypothetical protein
MRTEQVSEVGNRVRLFLFFIYIVFIGCNISFLACVASCAVLFSLGGIILCDRCICMVSYCSKTAFG